MSDGGEFAPVPDELRALLEAEKAGGDAPTVDARERVLLRLAGTIGLGAAPGGPNTGAAPPAQSISRIAPASAALLKTVAIFAAGAAAGAGTYHLARRPALPAPIVSPRSSPEGAPSAPPAPAATLLDEAQAPERMRPAPAPSRPVPALRARAATNPAAPAQADDGLAAERGLLEMARTALARGQTEGALAILRRHARQFPKGQLQEEREGLLVQALVAAGEYKEARERAARFTKLYPRSLFAPGVDQALRSIP
jgi:TolA-binding protein